ncbi:MAG: hypothetical protein BA870_03075 [Desulfuromonadales bacterium C00003094]|nr:MAG: hypothetical protein BA870_03075 [Desulfuromonadales bacterium C00003094]OEU72269.1 MAG: hypothetical protein BA869_04585 [Desulfuromonadales bacterium C00003107]
MVLLIGGLLVLPASRASAASLPDPTRPPQRFLAPAASGPVVADSWQLGSILIAPQRRVAVINGRPLSVGDQVSGAKVLTIEPGQVRLRRGNREIMLDLLPVRPTVSAVAEKK